MFRDTKKTDMCENHVGVGSVICGGENSSLSERFLIVGSGSKVALIANDTFEIISDWIEVADPNFLSSEESRNLCSKISNKLNWTFTDFFFSAKGMKNTEFKNTSAK